MAFKHPNLSFRFQYLYIDKLFNSWGSSGMPAAHLSARLWCLGQMKLNGWHDVHARNMNTLWWRHQMETFSALLAIWAGNSPVTGEFPHNGQWRGALMLSLICAWMNDWVNNREAGDLRRHRAHYDVIVMVHALQYFHVLWFLILLCFRISVCCVIVIDSYTPMLFGIASPVPWQSYHFPVWNNAKRHWKNELVLNHYEHDKAQTVSIIHGMYYILKFGMLTWNQKINRINQ